MERQRVGYDLNSGQLTAAVPAADTASAGTAWVTVFSPAPGGGTSNVAYFEITYPSTSVSFQAGVNYAASSAPWTVTAGDFNGDGKLDLVLGNYDTPTVSVLLGACRRYGF